ncbi:MAG: bifunctional adenosylcobinamide kinase/adenosylcobinamide-phosphate guanylyltransferase [Polyangiales bacterium]|nr:bifunctional adenosylcobinamide kinase/adenosylcobinamide-phosphate guanylyltransferase [Myxococcales bacterium]MCB9659487.1 bifunctional adenosylcobinamide kinase/adenosylcobinamide-phosphate guanylyltransferase [Sandaracinaceae bacterium]
MAHLVVIGGGARSGKSAFAERRAAAHTGERRFLATCIAFDDEMRARVAAHQRDRGDAFVTVEVPDALEAALDASHHASVVVIDCLTLWLTNLLLADLSDEAIAARVELLVAALARVPGEVLLVTNEVGMGIVPEHALARRFRDVAGRAHQRLAREADELYFAVMGTLLRLRPAPVALATDCA